MLIQVLAQQPHRKSLLAKTKIYYKNYYKVHYKHYYKSYYKYKGKWYYKWKYTYKYYWKYTWKHYFKYTYKTVTTTSRYQQNIINNIKNIAKNYNVDGIQLDYVRYPGTAHYYKNSNQIIANFVNNVKTVLPANMELSCVVMPEGSTNAYYYGQDYNLLTKYCDFLAPMVYKGNYGKSTSWITSSTNYIVQHSNSKPVYVGITAYYSDFNLRALSGSEMQTDVNSARKGGASGIILFKYNYGFKGSFSWN